MRKVGGPNLRNPRRPPIALNDQEDEQMIRVLKQGATEAEKVEADRKVRQTVEAILEDVAASGRSGGPGAVGEVRQVGTSGIPAAAR